MHHKLQWETMAEITADLATGIKLSMMQGTRVEVDNSRTVSALNFTGAQAADAASLFPMNVPFVFARHNPIAADVPVDVGLTRR